MNVHSINRVVCRIFFKRRGSVDETSMSQSVHATYTYLGSTATGDLRTYKV